MNLFKVSPKELINGESYQKKRLVHVLLREALIKRGRKVYAQHIVDNMLSNIKKLVPQQNPYLFFQHCILVLCPLFSLRTKKVAAQKLKIPVYLKEERRYFFALRWLLEAAELRKDADSFEELLAKECVDVFYLRGQSI